ncbi:MAG TPA: hypothetical protein VF142_07895 [Longimicrobium sp.]
MKKLTLHLEDLRIDSFTTSPAEKPKGTVFGEQCTCYTQCTCPGCPTCDASCNGSCGGASCDLSCGGTCDYSCECTNFSCDYTCDGYATYPNNQYNCVLC